MYIPRHFHFNDQAEKLGFMRRYSFATMVTAKDNVPIATQLPFVINDYEGKIILTAHFAIANEQVKYIEDAVSLIIFSEPHAYISPSHYDNPQSVPTWDYIAVHAYGKARMLNDDPSKMKVLEQMIRFYEPGYMEQWNSLSDKYKTGMLKGIAAFEVEVTDLLGQKKLSQNKTAAERERIIRQLESSGLTTEKDLADYIKDEGDRLDTIPA
jgi:transcriptional regulator